MTTRRMFKTISATAIAAVAVVLVAGLAGQASAVPQIESTYGSQSPWLSAEINALGGSGGAAYRGGLSTILNPAGLALATGWRLDAGFSLDHHEEDRFVKLFDNFDNEIADASIASNQNTFLNTGFALAGRLNLGERPVGIGLSLADRRPFDYRFDEEIRDPSSRATTFDVILEQRRYEVEGTLRDLSFGLATEAENVSFGASVHYAFGERTESWLRRDNDTSDGLDSYTASEVWDLSGFNATLGVQVEANERLTLGVAYETPLSLRGDLDTSLHRVTADTTIIEDSVNEHSLQYPASLRFAAAFYPRHDPRTTLTMDIVLTDWSDLRDDRIAGPLLEDVVDVQIGLQHTFQGDRDMRFGFRRYDSYGDSEGGNSIFSAGAGVPIGDGRFSFSLEFNKVQTWAVPHHFAYPSGFIAPDAARVDDMRVRLGAGWSKRF